jgi:hypothetical protein
LAREAASTGNHVLVVSVSGDGGRQRRNAKQKPECCVCRYGGRERQ